MKQIAVISGKGGTGKTVVTGGLAALAKSKIMVDCDVDAADLHLLLHPLVKERHDFRSGQTAVIDKKSCSRCGECLAACRFGAIKTDYRIESFSCEGCALCSYLCPHGAIRMEENVAGEWFISDTRYGPFVHAKLGIAEENSGKLVVKIKQVAKELAEKQALDYMIIDGPPGIGCPVIASLSGVDCVLIVTEPTLSGLHDAKRVMELAKHFNIPAKLVVNKYDLNPSMTERVEEFCLSAGVPVSGKIVFDKTVVKALVEGKTIIEYAQCAAGDELRKIWEILKS
ncbi:MAG: P-loop NTPase [Candidatus Omnitrophica bacterium]|jgi:MinD superfamily P-loop ATPase|nr:P-loop NTPase [Candidatus Omnitrophota bacterium]MDD5518935.1 P-loop NTPase [Candidatus Omnitrophota bacterium]